MTWKILLLLLALASGEPRDASAKQGSVKLWLATHSSKPSSVGFEDGATVRIDAVWVTVRDLRFLASCKGGGSTIAIPGPITGELLTGRIVGLPESVKLDPGQYCAFDLAFRRSRGKNDDAPRDLHGASLVINGRRSDGIHFVVRCRLDTSPKLAATAIDGFAISEADTQLILSADVARWMAGIDLSTAEVSGEAKSQEIRIDDKTNAELLARFRENVNAGLGMYLDSDGDRKLGEGERARPIASGGR